MTQADDILLQVEDLTVEFRLDEGAVKAVDGVSFAIRRGEILGLVGESGSGKSVTSLAIMGLLPARVARVAGGRIVFDGQDLLRLSAEELRRLRGDRLGMIFQEPLSALNPVFTVGHQIITGIRAHEAVSHAAARARAIELLTLVHIADPAKTVDAYPFQMSGGMRQRVLIAMALASHPDLLIADEPTTALDVTIQAQILDLLREIREKTGVAILFITHDLAVIAELCDRVAVLYAGEVQEHGPVSEVFTTPRHPYTRGLLACIADPVAGKARDPDRGTPAAAHRGAAGMPFRAALHVRSGTVQRETPRDRGRRNEPRSEVPAMARDSDQLLNIEDARKAFGVVRRRGLGVERKQLRAVDGVTLGIRAGESFGIVGESGSGKSTLGRLVLGLEKPTGGSVRYRGAEVSQLVAQDARAYWREVQVVFQDPFSSLNPRMRVGRILAEPLRNFVDLAPADHAARIEELLRLVGLPESAAQRFPHELSGRPAPARRDRRSTRGEPESARRRRGGFGTRRLGPGADRQPPHRPAQAARAHLPLHHAPAQPVCLFLRPHRRALSRAGDGGLRRHAVLLDDPRHPYTQALISAIPAVDPARRRQRVVLVGRDPEPHRSATGLPIRAALPASDCELQRASGPHRGAGDERRIACHVVSEAMRASAQ